MNDNVPGAVFRSVEDARSHYVSVLAGLSAVPHCTDAVVAEALEKLKLETQRLAQRAERLLLYLGHGP